MAILEVTGLSKHFGELEVIRDISFSLEKGESLAIIGSSGSGKTTLLRCLTALETPDTGVIRVSGDTVFDAAQPRPKGAQARANQLRFGLVFQSFNLFPQYTALKNVTLAAELLAKERADYKANKKPRSRKRDARRWRAWDFLPRRTITRTSSPAGSSSAWPSPGR